MADAADEDLFADLYAPDPPHKTHRPLLTLPSYDGEADEPETTQPQAPAQPTQEPTPVAPEANDASAVKQDEDDGDKPFDPAADDMQGVDTEQMGNNNGFGNGGFSMPEPERERPVTLKDDG